MGLRSEREIAAGFPASRGRFLDWMDQARTWIDLKRVTSSPVAQRMSSDLERDERSAIKGELASSLRGYDVESLKLQSEDRGIESCTES
ncbi:hypothetical protein KQX54_017348 [Cotesia glomerata]|uniref:Uncharacterized protein n=1 Tax=Cotesia glomerata TaxID=32391 RepID=A0AAV7IG38_COTGL|nr:hypothetical protein KQX54_017348 [Cotesia glomerata]